MTLTPVNVLIPVILTFAAGGTAHYAKVTKAPNTASAVIATDERWTVAEQSGDVANVDVLLLPEYRTVFPDGTKHNKEAILEGTRQGNAGACGDD